jgi:hypothetical protein
MRNITFILFFFGAVALEAQDILNYRPKLAEFSYESLSRYNVFVKSNDEGPVVSDIEQDRLLRLRLGAPIVLKKSTIFGVQLKYYRQSYAIAREMANPEDDVFRHLDENPLTNAGLNFLFQKDFSEKTKLTLLGVAEIGSDKWVLNRNSSRYIIVGEWTKEVSTVTKIGYGGVVNYALGVWNVYPKVSYNRKINPNVLLEVNLPGSVNLRYHPNDKTYLIAQTEFSNWRFNITDALENRPGDLTVQRADIYYKIKLEREIHDWLWFGIDLGYVNNVNYFVVEPGKRQRDAIQSYDLKDSAYIRFSIFMLPPRKLWEAISN